MKPVLSKIHCSRCLRLKPIEEFYNDHRTSSGKYGHCKACNKLYDKKRKLNKLQLTIIDYEDMFKKQGGVCAICKSISNVKGKTKELHIDHGHVSKKFRGLLCGKCNQGLGLFNDSVELLIRAAEYVIENE